MIIISDAGNINIINEWKWSLKDHTAPLQIMASLNDGSRGVIYHHNMFVVQASGVATSCYAQPSILNVDYLSIIMFTFNGTVQFA